MVNFGVEDFKNILRERSFTEEEIEKNWQKYLEAFLAITVDDYLSKLSEAERNEVAGNDDMNDKEGLSRIMERFLKHYQNNRDKFDPPLNELNFISKIKEYNVE